MTLISELPVEFLNTIFRQANEKLDDPFLFGWNREYLTALRQRMLEELHKRALEIARCVTDAHALVAEHGYNVGLGLAHKRYGTEVYHEAYGIWEAEDEARRAAADRAES